MAATEQLKVKITADASQAKSEISKFKTQLKDTSGEAGNLTGALTKTAGAVGALVIACKAWKAVIKNAIDVAAVGDAIKDNAQKVFMSTTAYQEWGYVLKQNGIEISQLKTSMRTFAKQVATGSDTLKKYGITATNVDQAFEQAVYTIQNMGTETEKIAAATELFGTRAMELMPMLNMTNQETQNLAQSYRILGGTMSNELIAASDTCTDSITAMKASWSGLKNVLAQWILPAVIKVVQWLTVLIAKVRIVLAAFFGLKETFGGSSGNSKGSVAASSGSIAGNTGKTADNLKKANKQAKALRRTLMGIDELTKLAEKATAAAASGGGGGGGSVGGVSVGGADISELANASGNLFNDDMINKIEEFRKKVDAVKEKINGAYLIWKGWLEILTPGQTFKGISDMYEGFKKIFPFLQDIEDKVKSIWGKVKEKIETKLGIKIPTWEGDIKPKWEGLKKKISDIWANLKVKFPEWKKELKAKWDKLMAKFKPKPINFSLRFSAAVNDLRAWINGHVIAKINGVFNKVPILKNHQIPYLARGGVLTTPTAAMMAEYAGARQNPEIVAPQSIMYDTMMKANGDMVAAFATMTRQVIAAIENKDIDIRIGDEQIARSAQRGNLAYKNRTGSALITV